MTVDVPPQWWELEVDLPSGPAEDAAGLLVDAGAAGVETLPSVGASVTLRATYADQGSIDELVEHTLATLAEIDVIPETVRVTRREEEDWNQRFRERLEPMQIGERIWVVPSFKKGFALPEGGIEISLDPGMAFGTGQHATTALCLVTLQQRIIGTRKQSVLDVGCGSGILSIAAAKLGANRIVGIDNDPFAVGVARENASANRVDVDLLETPLAQIREQFDCVMANILAPILIELAPDLVRCTKPGGWLLVSGLLLEQEAEVRSEFLGQGMSLVERDHDQEWATLLFESRG